MPYRSQPYSTFCVRCGDSAEVWTVPQTDSTDGYPATPLYEVETVELSTHFLKYGRYVCAECWELYTSKSKAEKSLKQFYQFVDDTD